MTLGESLVLTMLSCLVCLCFKCAVQLPALCLCGFFLPVWSGAVAVACVHAPREQGCVAARGTGVIVMHGVACLVLFRRPTG